MNDLSRASLASSLAHDEPLPALPEVIWRAEQLAQLTDHFTARRAATRVGRDRRAAADDDGPGDEGEHGVEDLRSALGVEPVASRLVERRQEAGPVGADEVEVSDENNVLSIGLLFGDAKATGVALVVPPPDGRTEHIAESVRELRERGYAVVVLARPSRAVIAPESGRAGGKDARHILHRLAFPVGRTPEGLEIASADALVRVLRPPEGSGDPHRPTLIRGVGSGARLAMMLGALDSDLHVEASIACALFDRDGAPIDERLHGSAALPADRELIAILGRRVRLFEVDGPGTATNADAFADAINAWFRDATERMFRACERRLRTEIDGLRRTRPNGLLETAPSDRKVVASALRREIAEHIRPDDLGRVVGRRSRLLRVTFDWVAHEVELALPTTSVRGHLLLPRSPGPHSAVICQHGLDGQPGDITGLIDHPDPAYHAFGARLASRGYVVFAPYLTVPSPHTELLAPAIEAATAAGAMRTGFELAKLRAAVDFLAALPEVDATRIGYYGLSYGGYSALWMAGVEERLAAVVVSGHFNDWTSKLTDDTLDTSYLRHDDEDFTTFGALRTLSHTELIAAMYPRPVLVEWADGDDTTTPEWHARAWAEVEAWAAAWDHDDRVEREAFRGVHEIGGMRSFGFLDRWLRPNAPSGRDYAYELRPGADLDGISDHSPETYPFLTRSVGREDAPVRTLVRCAVGSPPIAGIDLRVSRDGDPRRLVVRLLGPDGAVIRSASIDGDVIHPLWDAWYEVRWPPIELDGALEYTVEITPEADTPSDRFTLYGPRPLGGLPPPDRFDPSYRLAVVGETTSRTDDTHQFGRRLLDPPVWPDLREIARPGGPGEVGITADWSLEDSEDAARRAGVDEVDLFLRQSFGLALPRDRDPRGPVVTIELDTALGPEGHRLDVGPRSVVVTGGDARGILRGAFRLIDDMREAASPTLPPGTRSWSPRFARRITTPAMPAGVRYSETSHPSIYTAGLLRKIVRDGFNAVWRWVNLEEIAHDSAVFPELDQPPGAARITRLEEAAALARRHGVETYLYLTTTYDHPVPEWFYERYPETKGYGFFGHPMCTSDERVRRYHAEIVSRLISGTPSVVGVIVTFDIEGYYYCGNDEAFRALCPRCRKRTQVDLGFEAVMNLRDAIRGADPAREIVLWSYGSDQPWVHRLLERLPADMAIQVDFSKGLALERDGIRHVTGDYNLTLIGPPESYLEFHERAVAVRRPFITKTEHAVSQEAIFVPHIPAMDQWAARAERIREFAAAGVFANWDHYGYASAVTARILNDAAFDPAPGEASLERLARREFGAEAGPHVRTAWRHVTDAIREFPYSDSVARSPGPLQKGPSHPLWLDPAHPNVSRWRSWQNDLAWTEPWGPEIAGKYLRRVRDGLATALDAMDAARLDAAGPFAPVVDGEWRLVATLHASFVTVCHLLEWIPARDRFHEALDPDERRDLAAALERIATAELQNARRILPVLEQDSRLGFASDGGGVIRGGLFTPSLVREKIGQLEDLLVREIPEAVSQPTSAAAV